MFKFSIYFVIFISHINNSICSREKRFLIFPRGNPTRHQFIAGIGVPLDLEPESLTSGYVFKAQYFLPYNESQLHPTRLRLERNSDDEHMKVDKYGQAYETYDVEAEVKSVLPLAEQNENDDDARWAIYQTLEKVLRSKNIDGKQCMLRAICEASQLPFSHESGLLGELFHILFIPSTTTLRNGLKNDYIFAEELGLSDENCEKVFRQCTYSLMNIFSRIH